MLARRWLRRRQHAALAAGARVITVLAPPLADPAGGEALWGHLTGLLRPPWARLWHGQPHIGFEYTWAGPVMTISVWVPGTVPPGMIERAIEAAWPGAHAVAASAAPPFPPGALATGGTLRLARTEILPLKTDHDADPLRALAAAGSGLAAGEHAIVQVLARPVTGARLRRARRAARQLRTGRPARLSSRLLDVLTPGGHSGTARRAAARSDPELAAEVRASVIKSAGPQWETQIRYATATTAVPAGRGRLRDTAAQAQARARLRGLAHGLASATALYAGRNWLARRHLRHPAEQITARRFRRGGLLSVPELAAIARLPADASVPGLSRAGARAVAPPAVIPVPGPGVRPLGVSDTGVPRPVGITVADARHHLRVIGPTGTGKTTLIIGQILADATAGRGVVFIDPKGDAVTDLLARLPENVAGKVVLFDPADRAAPPCLNVLQGDGSGTDHDVITDNVTGIFRRIFAAFWGPRTDDIFRAACLTLLRSVPPGSGQVTLADIPALLTQDAYRRRLTAGIRDPVLAGFWTWYEQLSEASRAHAIGPLMNKLRAFLLRSFARQAIAAGPVHLHHDRRARPRRAVPGPPAQRHPRRGNRAAGRVVHRRRDLAGRVPPRRHPPASARRRGPVHRRMPELPHPALPAGRPPRRGPRLPAVDHDGPPEPRPAPRRPGRRDLRERPLPGHLHRQPRRRPHPRTPHPAEPDRPRPVPPGRLPGRRPPGRRQRRNTRVHPAHPAAAARRPRPGGDDPPRRPRRLQRQHRPHSRTGGAARRQRPPPAHTPAVPLPTRHHPPRDQRRPAHAP